MARMPKNIQKAGKKADELIKAQSEVADEIIVDETIPGEEPIAPEEPVETPVVDEATPEPEVDYKHKYDVLQGKYNAEVPRLNDELADQKIKMSEVLSKVDSIETKLVEPEEEEPEGVSYLKNEMPAVEEAIRYMVRKLVDEEMSKVNDRVQNVESVAKDTTMQAFHKDLTKTVPDWEKVNYEPKFVEWLGSKERYSGSTRHDLMRAAYSRQDADAVSTFFLDYLGESKAPPGTPKPTTDKFVAPPPGSETIPTPAQESGVVTRAMVHKFYKDKTAGRYKNRDKEAQKIENQINLAMSKGEIR